MKIKTSLILTILLIFICCIGAASAADDINDDSLTADDDAVVAEQVDDVDLQSMESDDATLEVNNNEEVVEASGTATVYNWTDLENKGETVGTDYTINLVDGITYKPTSQILFKNNAKIIGTENSYISGSYKGIPFKCSNTALTITFQNVNFKDISSTMLMQMLTTNTILDGCTFTNVNASSSGHNSVIYNNYGTMNITDCTFSNCRAAFGVITNHNAGSTTNIILNVKNSKFENNYGVTEPGAINNCGILTVYNSTFIGNHAVWWAGAIHTHSNANTLINKSTFKSNTAGWNGGALFTYSVLRIYDSCFEDNNCSTSAGGGAIGAYNYGSQYNIIIDNCTFKKNNNVNGNGGAIATLNGGYLNVYNSMFIANYAANGQAICAANENIENGTNDQPYLAIVNNTFINHTGSSDTVVINGVVSEFTNNTFINSTQNTHYGTGNTYNSIYILMTRNNEVLGIFNNEDILNAESTFDSMDGFWQWYSYASINQNFDTIYLKAYKDEWDDAYGIKDLNNPNFISSNIQFTIIGLDDNVLFYLTASDPEEDENGEEYYPVFDYDLDSGTISKNMPAENGEGTVSSDSYTITHKNIIFDCPVKVGSKNFKFIDCTFKRSFEVTDKGNTGANIVVSFVNCTFDFDTSEIKTISTATLKFGDDPTATDSNIAIANESDVVVVTLTDVDGNPIKGATVTYNTTSGVEGFNVTGDDGKFNIVGLTGEFTINVTYVGNESYNPSNKSASFNFKLPAVKTTLIINSTEKGIVVITVVDNENKPITNLEVKYSINNGANSTNTTGADGTISIPVTGEGEIKAYFEGNENYLKSEGSYKYNFTETTPAGNGTSGNGTSGNGTSGNGTSTNTGKTTTNTPKVTKKATKITAKKATFKAKKKTKKYTIVLKSGKKAVKKVKVTLKVGKKTYKATTNSKGKATFKITKLNKKGKYTAVIKFKGNKNFKATTKKVKITVKK